MTIRVRPGRKEWGTRKAEGESKEMSTDIIQPEEQRGKKIKSEQSLGEL